jgi:hypothetical protein
MDILNKITFSAGAVLVWLFWNYFFVRWWGYASILEFSHWRDWTKRDLFFAILESIWLVGALIWIWS